MTVAAAPHDRLWKPLCCTIATRWQQRNKPDRKRVYVDSVCLCWCIHMYKHHTFDVTNTNESCQSGRTPSDRGTRKRPSSSPNASICGPLNSHMLVAAYLLVMYQTSG